MIYSLVLSFHSQQKSGLGFGEAKTVFVGLENYVQVFQSETFMEGIARLGLYCLIYIPCMVGGAVVFALLLDASVAKARKLFQLLVFLPHAVPGVIAALIWAYLYTPGISAGSGPPRWRHPDQFPGCHMVLPSIVNIGVWEWTGYNVIILFTALQAVPPGNPGSRTRGRGGRRDPGCGEHQVPADPAGVERHHALHHHRHAAAFHGAVHHLQGHSFRDQHMGAQPVGL